MNDDLIPEPPGWVDERCVFCHRKLLDDGGDRLAVARYELIRGTPVTKAARTARVPAKEVSKLHRSLVKSGEIGPSRWEAVAERRRRVADGRRAKRRAERRAADLAALRDAGPVTSMRFAHLRGLPVSSARRRLSDLRKAGLAVAGEESRGYVWRALDGTGPASPPDPD